MLWKNRPVLGKPVSSALTLGFHAPTTEPGAFVVGPMAQEKGKPALVFPSSRTLSPLPSQKIGKGNVLPPVGIGVIDRPKLRVTRQSKGHPLA